MASKATAGPEILVNSTTTNYQGSTSVAGIANGGWVVTWISLSNKVGTGYDVLQQSYDAKGQRLGNETQVNTYTDYSQDQSRVTALTGGGWVVTWTSESSDFNGGYSQEGSQDGIYQQRYDAFGNKSRDETHVNFSTPYDQSEPSVTALTDGGWVVTWSTYNDTYLTHQIFQQRYDATGNTAGGETRVSVSDINENTHSSTAALADGGWLVTYQLYFYDGQENARTWAVYQHRYNADGTASGGATRVEEDNNSNGYESSSATGLADGGWVVAINTFDAMGHTGVSLQRYDKTGTVAGSPIVVDPNDVSGSQDGASVTALAQGWVVTWTGGADGSGKAVYQQRYDASGKMVGTVTQVNVFTTGDQVGAHVTSLEDGGWVVTWQSDGQDGDKSGVYQRHFAPNIFGTTQANSLAGTQWDEYLDGGSGNDTLNGKGGADIMAGGRGDDTYVVDNAADDVQELMGQGVDLVKTSVSYSISTRVAIENLTLTGIGEKNATGNAGDNVLLGSASANYLYGKGGADKLVGNGGGDYLDGGAGTDRLEGGAGDDRYVIDKTDILIERQNGGKDLVQASFSYTLRDNFEDLALSGRSNISGTGNGLSNRLDGNTGNNRLDGGGGADELRGGGGNDTLIGGAGADTLYGGTGADLMTGGKGADVFVFLNGSVLEPLSQATDTITDFDSMDVIDLSIIDANSKTHGDQAFKFIAGRAFTGHAGELRFEKMAGDTWIYADVNGDRKADFSLHLDGAMTMKSDEFVF